MPYDYSFDLFKRAAHLLRFAAILFSAAGIFLFAGCAGVSSSMVAGAPPMASPSPTPANPNATTVLYATDASGNLFVVNAGDGDRKALPLSGGPAGVAISRDGSRAYVTLAAANRLAVIDTLSNATIDEIPVGSQPMAVAVSPDGRFAYVANTNDGTVSVINTASNQVVNTITTDSAPWTLAFSPDGSQVYVAIIDFSGFPIGGPHPENAIVVIDVASQTITKKIPSITGISLAASPTRHEMYLVVGENDLAVINTDVNEVVAEIPLDSDQQKDVAVSADGQSIFVIGHGMVDIGHEIPALPTVPSTVYVVSAEQRAVVATAHTDPGLIAIALDPAGKTAFLLADDTWQQGMKTMDLTTRTFSAVQPIGGTPMRLAVSRH